MVHRVETTGTIGSDGSLTVDQALPIPPGRHRLVLLIEDMPLAESLPEWSDFVKAMYGSLADIPIVREPEGDYEQRENID